VGEVGRKGPAYKVEKEIHRIIQEKNLEITTKKVQGHSNCVPNQEVDDLAKKTLREKSSRGETFKGGDNDFSWKWRNINLLAGEDVVTSNIIWSKSAAEWLTECRVQEYLPDEEKDKISWKWTWETNKLKNKGRKENNFEETFIIKKWADELPTLENLRKRKYGLYGKYSTCLRCKKDKENWNHIWLCWENKKIIQEIIEEVTKTIIEMAKKEDLKEVDKLEKEWEAKLAELRKKKKLDGTERWDEVKISNIFKGCIPEAWIETLAKKGARKGSIGRILKEAWKVSNEAL